MSDPRRIVITKGDEVKYFNSVSDCARYLYGHEWANGRATISTSIRRDKRLFGYNISYTEKPPPRGAFKRLFFDIETSPNVVFSWRVGRKLFVSPDNIIKERAIICICYKWEGQEAVSALRWNGGDDREMLIKFADVFNRADEVVGQNSDRFDIPWFRTRCLFHRIPVNPRMVSVDTLQIAMKKFNFNSNKLDYMGQFLGVGEKIKTDFDLWKRVMDGDRKAMAEMVRYCQQDVQLLEKVFRELYNYTEHKTHMGVFEGGSKCDCPKCAGEAFKFSKRWITKTGVTKVQLQCNGCGAYYTVSNRAYCDTLVIKTKKIPT